MTISGATALVTGANRGIGAEFVRQLRERGARRIYAATRTPSEPARHDVRARHDVCAEDEERAHSSHPTREETEVTPLLLDVTNPQHIERAAATAGDVDLLINNAGIASGENLVGGDMNAIRHEVEVNLFGPLAISRAFAPVLAAQGGGTILNVLSAAAWFSAPGATSYGMAKAASWAMTEGLRVELAHQSTHVASLLMAVVDTDMTRGVSAAKLSPQTLVTRALDGIEQRQTEILADDATVMLKQGLPLSPTERYADLLAAP